MPVEWLADFDFDCQVKYFSLPLLETVNVGEIVTTLGIVAIMNAVNFADGVDGLAAGVCVIAAMTLAVVGLFAEGPTTIHNIYNWRVKETERLEGVCTELRKLGAEVEEGRDYLVVTPPDNLQLSLIHI